MADSVDRVFVHALNTVKRIPRLGQARPPPSDRLRLYGLYKQSMEGDVEGVMERPRGSGEEIRSDQEKWDAWNNQKGVSRTEAKRRYISTLIDTMHRYASQTPDARELVAELEFVWDQIKSNAPSDTSSHSNSNSNSVPYPLPRPAGGSPSSSSGPPIYPSMSHRGSRNPRANTKDGGEGNSQLRVLSPISQNQKIDIVDGDADGEDDGEPGGEAFVDAPDSQIAENERDSQEESSSRAESPQRARGKQQSAGGAFLGPIARYLRLQTRETQRMEDTTSKWQKRMEGALIKMNAEIAALREQIDMQQRGSTSMYNSILHPFRHQQRYGLLRWLSDSFSSITLILFRHIVIDAFIIFLVFAWMHYRGIPPQRLETLTRNWIRRIQQTAILRKMERLQRHESCLRLPFARAVAVLEPRPSR